MDAFKNWMQDLTLKLKLKFKEINLIHLIIIACTAGGKLFDPLLILYVYPLTKKWSVYNFNGRFIWTVRDRITTNNPEKRISKKL